MWSARNLYWCCFVIFSLVFPLAGSVSDSPQREEKELHVPDKNSSSSGNTITAVPITTTDATPPIEENCSERERKEVDCTTNVECRNLNKECLDCNFNCSCVYGQEVNVTCRPRTDVTCLGEQEFLVSMKCLYCYQTAHWEHTCSGTEDCLAINSPREMFVSNCTVNSDILCLGERVFKKKLPCNWTSGYKWSTALLLSITFGGFGADRFYLGHWQEGIGKLFSFGGLGVWTIMDVILIAIRYLGPADGSLYI